MNPTPSINFGLDTFICEGESMLLDAGNPGASYAWQDGSMDQTYLVTQEGTYSVFVNNFGYSDTDSIYIEMYYPPTIELGASQQICPNETITLQPEVDANNYLWQDNSTFNYYSVTEPGSYWLSVSNECGNETDTIEIIEGVAPDIDLGPDLIITPGETIYLGVPTYNATYLWFDNSTYSSVAITEPGSYWVLVTNSCGSVYDEVYVDCDCVVDIPNAFSPNGDGNNDEFIITINSIPEEGFFLQIFNRWGEPVFISKDKNQGWDGKINGNIPKQSSSYIYILNYKDITGEAITLKGSIYLMR